MLNNPLGVILYLILRNDHSWGILSDKDKCHVLSLNEQHNSFRDDYLSPEKNQKNWDSYSNDNNKDGKDISYSYLNNALLEYNPKSVLEVGPGAGYMSNMICNHGSVRRYDTIDINDTFSSYIKSSINNEFKDDSLLHDHYVGNASIVSYNKTYDMIVMLNSVHHIPDRFVLFDNLINHLSENGIILAVDPSHYLKRILILSNKLLTKGYLKSSYYKSGNNLSTHHMCTLGEYKKIIKNHNMQINNIEFNKNKLINIKPFNKYLSSQIGVILKK
jgi:2-polyprenyl-3-methyl-5-hydroxy-6-metoxy-1,4-benzoquinol methylase